MIVSQSMNLKSMGKTSGRLKTERTFGDLLSDSNTNVSSTFNRRVSLFYRYPLEASSHMVCSCTLNSAGVVCPGTSALVCQQD